MMRPTDPPCGWEDIRCNYQSIVNLNCGHTVHLPCLEALDALDVWKCSELVPVKCDVCDYEKEVHCHDKRKQETERPAQGQAE